MSVKTVPIPVMKMQSVTTLKAATGVSAGQDSLEMDTTAQVLLFTTCPPNKHNGKKKTL